jgi:hypothetical protein
MSANCVLIVTKSAASGCATGRRRESHQVDGTRVSVDIPVGRAQGFLEIIGRVVPQFWFRRHAEVMNRQGEAT